MPEPNDHDLRDDDLPLRVGSLFSGYGGLDLAIEHALNAETLWFSENNEPVARVFTHHWPDVPNLGDITTINWNKVPPVDVLCGGFPCQDVSTVGKRAGLAPGTRSGLWSRMAQAIEVLQPRLVVIENVRGLLSAPARRTTDTGEDNEQRNPDDAISNSATLRNLEPDPWNLADGATRPLRAAGAVLGDLADLGMDARWIGLPASLVGAPHHRLRIFVFAWRQDAVPHPAGFRLHARRRNSGKGTVQAWDDSALPPDHRPRPQRAAWLAGQERRTRDLVVPDRGHLHRWGRYAQAIARWEHITGRPAPNPALLKEDTGPRPSPAFVEWLMGLPEAWVTDPDNEFTANQQLMALGNGVVPIQAVCALKALSRGSRSWRSVASAVCRSRDSLSSTPLLCYGL